MDALRIRPRRSLESTVWYYQNPAKDRWVTVVGVYPQGEMVYYLSLRTIARRGRDGRSRVHFEGLFVPPSEKKAALRPDDTELAEQISQWQVLSIARAGVLGWVDAREGLRPEADWCPHTVTVSELVNLTGLRWADEHVRRELERLDWPDGSRRRPAQHRWREATMARLAARQGRTNSLRDHPALLTYRAANALKAVVEDDQHTVLLWGLEVMPHIANGLAGLGYICRGQEWLQVGQLPHRATAAAHLLLGCGPRHPSVRPRASPLQRR
ncbi:hypothetical protein O7626_30265 [Micromonospora sp. WMMD1102]|uniref:hypothetical protein n=1 Tax=Micromonospora sp. WMMD1102 TaxID=3016105 RepID=UPI002415061C|nr:hypothetical protein [Micromonospora sp. WMMD1102]MDG4790156.1 hypothetical protein [Micromonospora sp. WMMD1102]